jgi:dinuclear metal center YbgI/SA1388 family protein
MDLSAVTKVLGQLAPLQLAEKWDNVGLLAEPYTRTPISVIFLTNDLTEQVLEEAIVAKANMIVSYHPPIFEAWKQLTNRNVKQRIILRALEHRIAIYSPHSALDSVSGGMNDWLAEGLGPLEGPPRALSPPGLPGGSRYSVLCPRPLSAQLTQTLSAKGWVTSPAGASPILLSVPKGDFSELLVLATGETDGWQLSETASAPLPGTGGGRLALLREHTDVQVLIPRIKKHLGLTHLRFASPVSPSLVKSVAMCAGSGASVFKGVKADLFLTGELSHHEVLALVAAGACVLLTEHSNSERGYLPVLKRKIEAGCPGVQVLVSTVDADPLRVV